MDLVLTAGRNYLHSHIRRKGKGKGERLRDGGHLSCQTQDKIRPKTFSTLPDRHPLKQKRQDTNLRWTLDNMLLMCLYDSPTKKRNISPRTILVYETLDL